MDFDFCLIANSANAKSAKDDGSGTDNDFVLIEMLDTVK